MLTQHQTASATDEVVNIANRLSEVAARIPQQVATVEATAYHPRRPKPNGSKFSYRTRTFAELEEESNRIAAGLLRMGVAPGQRLVLMVPYSHDFVALTFALFKAGVVTVLIDPGMGRKNMIRCLAEVEPDGFVAIPLAHAVRAALRGRFPKARHLVTAGRRWFWGGETLEALRHSSLEGFAPARTKADDEAAIIFTTGSTGPPKGVLYSHGNFDHQVRQIAQRYDIRAGGVDLACFPLFGLFNGGMGTTTVIPDMDPTRPADADPAKLIDMMSAWKVSQSFASPALWTTLMRRQRDLQKTAFETFPSSMRQLFSAGAPVPNYIVDFLHEDERCTIELHTPYGATEALPVASISSREVREETGAKTAAGAGTCVGTRFSEIEWKVIAIEDGPLEDIADVRELPSGEIGELMVRGPVVTKRYVTRTKANALHKVNDGDLFWHRMGDAGYLDENDRFWICGRKAHRVTAKHGVMFTLPCEAIMNQHEAIYRSALIGVGTAGEQIPCMVCEPWPQFRSRSEASLRAELADLASSSALTESISPANIFLRKSLPVDIRHNAKIFRERLRPWCARRLRSS